MTLQASLLLGPPPPPGPVACLMPAGTGADPRDRRFCTVSQGLRYDPQAALVRTWLPELATLPTELAHQPWLATPGQLAEAGVQLGHPEQAGHAPAGAAATRAEETASAGEAAGQRWYPLPLVDPSTQVAKGPRQTQQQRAAGSRAAAPAAAQPDPVTPGL